MFMSIFRLYVSYIIQEKTANIHPKISDYFLPNLFQHCVNDDQPRLSKKSFRNSVISDVQSVERTINRYV